MGKILAIFNNEKAESIFSFKELFSLSTKEIKFSDFEYKSSKSSTPKASQTFSSDPNRFAATGIVLLSTFSNNKVGPFLSIMRVTISVISQSDETFLLTLCNLPEDSNHSIYFLKSSNILFFLHLFSYFIRRHIRFKHFSWNTYKHFFNFIRNKNIIYIYKFTINRSTSNYKFRA